MKYIILYLSVFTFACDDAKSVKTESIKIVEPVAKAVVEPQIDQEKVDSALEKSEAFIAFGKMKGDYTGEFVAEKFNKKKSPTMKNKIKFSLEDLDPKKGELAGSSIVAGGKRPFTGSYVFKDGIFTSKLTEPGDNKYDGVFEIKINTGEETVTGSWVANNKKLAVSERSFKLEKTFFKYDPKAKVTYLSFMKHLLKYRGEEVDQIQDSYYETKNINASTTKLKVKDVENLIQEDLALMRNAIYARHGYAFKTRKYRYYFEREVDWYLPFSTDVREELTDVEKANIKLLKRYEKHAHEYYDTFGR